ncbi:MAG: hypothetical protein Q9218_001351 [Villophora microphyllina]
MGEVKLRMPPDVSAEAALALHAEHLDAFKTGHPFSMVHGNWHMDDEDHSFVNTDYSNIAYNNRRLAWIDPRDGLVNVRNLELGQQIVYMLPNREKVHRLALSSDIVAATTRSGKCYAWDCATGAPSSIKLSSSWVSGFTTSGKSLLIAHGLENMKDSKDDNRDNVDPLEHESVGEDDTMKVLTITTWDLCTGITRSFSIQLHDQPDWRRYEVPLTIHMTPDSFVLLERRRGPPDRIFFTRCTLDGKIILAGSSGPLHRTFRSGYVDLTVWPQQQEASTMTFAELDRITVDQESEQFEYIRQAVTLGTRGIIRPVYDLRTNRLESPWETAMSCKHLELQDNKGKVNNYWFAWKNLAFRFCQDPEGCPSSIVLDQKTGESTKTYMQELDTHLSHREDEGWRRRNHQMHRLHPLKIAHPPILFVGDEIFMVRVYPKGFTAFCFDKNITMADESEEFRQRREDLRLARISRRKFQHPGGIVFTDEHTIRVFEKTLARHERESQAPQGIV